MSYKITVRPSGHIFEAEPSETLLQAGLRAGLNLQHSCSNGSCGGCRARLLSGDIVPSNHGDYHFSETERRQGWFLICSGRAKGDAEIEARELGSSAEMPEQRIQAKVSKVEHLQEEVAQLSVRTPRSSGLRFLAGQGVRLSFDGLRPQTLPIASCPCDSMHLRFHVRRRDDDPFSDFVFSGPRRGTDVELHGPCGDFTLDEESTRPLVFIAWESGFAPVSSIIDHAIQKDENRSIDLYWLTGIPRGHYLANHCVAWRDALDDFRYQLLDLAPAGTERLDRVVERIIRVHASLADNDYYLAVPGAAIESSRNGFLQANVPESRVHVAPLTHP